MLGILKVSLMVKTFEHEDTLAVGIVQTTLDARQAWKDVALSPRMSRAQDEHAWQEIRKALRAFQDGGCSPQIILLPELSLPRTRLDDFEELVSALNVMAIAGVDYHLNATNSTVQNQGIIFIPRGFFNGRPSRYCSRVVFGKTYGAPKEIAKLKNLPQSWTFVGDHNVYVFDCGRYGRFGVSICYDFMDIERSLIYRNKIEHLFVLAYNRDLGMFRSLADSLSRTVYCNVVVCNTGTYGGSLAVSPYYEAYRRKLFGHDGGGLFTAQVVQLPVRRLIEAIAGQVGERTVVRTEQEFKDPPPGLANLSTLALYPFNSPATGS